MTCKRSIMHARTLKLRMTLIANFTSESINLVLEPFRGIIKSPNILMVRSTLFDDFTEILLPESEYYRGT